MTSEKPERSPPGPRTAILAGVLFVVSALAVAGYSFYAAMFFAWMATTPGPEETHAAARLYCNIWTAIFIAMLVSAMAVLIWLVRSSRR